MKSDKKLLDGIASDLFGYDQRLSDYKAQFKSRCAASRKTIILTAQRDRRGRLRDMELRSKVYTLNAFNIIANQTEAATVTSTNKVPLASITVQYGGNPHPWKYRSTRWDASLGVLVSVLPTRSFAVQPVYSGATVTNNLVQETTTYPQWVPFAAANYRIFDHLPGARWPSGVYITLGLGINPNTKTTDGAAGVSLAWRDIMFSLLCHFTHDTRLVDGFYRGESLGPTFSGTLPTETYWTKTVALGISVRVPTVPGR
jgi:hypothetical protein